MNPYHPLLGDRDPVAVLGETPERIGELVSSMREQDFARPYAPDKWTAAQLLDHLAHEEIVYAFRVRMALTTPGYVVQPFDQSEFMAREPKHNPRDAFEVYRALRKFNLPLYRTITAEERERTVVHPERGQMTVAEMLELLAGHELHHMQHLQAIAAAR